MQTFRSLFAISFLCLAIAALPASASEPSKDAADPSVKLASVGIPVFEGRTVVNYIFLSIKVNLTAKADQQKLRDMEPYFRNALVSAAHKQSFAQKDRTDKLDEPRFQSVMKVEFTKIAGPGMIESIEIISQSPKKHR